MTFANLTEVEDSHIRNLLHGILQTGSSDAPAPDGFRRKPFEIAAKSSSTSLLNLPYDVLAIILQYLPPYELPRMRRLSKDFYHFLTADHVLSPLLRHHFPFHVRSSLRGPKDAKSHAPATTAEGESTIAEPRAASKGQIIKGAAKAFDLALRRFFNRTKGKPTSITVINGVRLDACYETETSYDHMFLVFHHVSGCVFIYDSGNRFPEHTYVTLDIRSLGVPWHGIRVHRKNVRQSVVLDKRILIVSGTKEFDNDPDRRIPQAVYTLHNYPKVELIGIWRGVQYHESLNSLCANDEWIGCRVSRHFVKLIKIDSLRSDRRQMGDGTLETGPSPNPLEITFQHPSKGFIKDVHLTKHHVFVYATVYEDNDIHGHSQVDVFRIDSVLDSNRDRPIYEIAHVRSVLLHSWQGMFMEYVGFHNPNDIPEAMRCQRWDKIYPHMLGGRYDGLPEEDENSVIITLCKTFRTNGNVPIGAVRIWAEPDTPRTGPPVLETIAPSNIIPFCVELEQSIQEDDADHMLLLPPSKDMISRAEAEGLGREYFEHSPYDPDIPICPDDVEMNSGCAPDPAPGDDASYIFHFQNGTLIPEAKRAVPSLPTPSVREAWYLEQDQTQRSSIITEEGMFHIFYDEPSSQVQSINTVQQQSHPQNLPYPTRLFPSHVQHIPLEDIFDEKIPLYDLGTDLVEEDSEDDYRDEEVDDGDGDDEDEDVEDAEDEEEDDDDQDEDEEMEDSSENEDQEEDEENRPAENAPQEPEVSEHQRLIRNRIKLQNLMANIRGGWSCYVWSAETWNGFLITAPDEAKMVILRYD
ncbi:hypothetical protein ABW19_dt0208208 [Dactylella cylindrospora]|nr:hypothetical protein ABW19_dt0208208 [Dactylella cylindrospora]